MKGYIEERAVKVAQYIVDNNATVRQTAKMFGISKSTIHKDVSCRINYINPLPLKPERYWILINPNVISGAAWPLRKNIFVKTNHK